MNYNYSKNLVFEKGFSNVVDIFFYLLILIFSIVFLVIIYKTIYQKISLFKKIFIILSCVISYFYIMSFAFNKFVPFFDSNNF